MTLSAAIYGAAPVVPYATAKGALMGLTRALAEAGADAGILVNAIAPRAATRLVGNPDIRRAAGVAPATDGQVETTRTPEQAAPVAAYLVHERCSVTGQFLAADAGRVARIFVGETRGYVDGHLSIEAVRSHWDEVNDTETFEIPANAAEQRRFADAALEQGLVA
jgi:hypothetical protein